MKYTKLISILLCTFLLCACSKEPANPPKTHSTQSVDSPYLQSQEVTEQAPSTDTAAPVVDKTALLAETELLAEGELVKKQDSYTFSITCVHKGKAEKVITVKETEHSLANGKCMLALRADTDGTYVLSHSISGYLPENDLVYTNTLSGKDSITLDPATLASDLGLLEE